MRGVRFVLLALLTFTGTAWAQFPSVSPETPTVLAVVSPDDVVARMMSFDRNRDGKVEKGELAERMQDLVARGDVDGDGALDGIEFRTLASAPPPPPGLRKFGSGSYGFADETSLSSRLHIDGALEDLRLTSPAKEQAAAVAKAFVDTLEQSALADLVAEMGSLLDEQQLADFKTALTTQHRTRSLMISKAGESTRTVFLSGGGPDASRRLDTYALPAERKAQAQAAFNEYKARLRLRDTERGELLARMQDVLSAEEQGDFRAAIERRPVVATNGMFFFGNGVVGGTVGSTSLEAVMDRAFNRGNIVLPRTVNPVERAAAK